MRPASFYRLTEEQQNAVERALVNIEFLPPPPTQSVGPSKSAKHEEGIAVHDLYEGQML